MKKESVLARIRAQAEPLVQAQGLVVWGIECVGSTKTIVRVFIDRKADDSAPESALEACDAQASPNGVLLDQCELIAKDLGLALDVEDIFPNAWVLEVSTPGLSRTFFTLSQMRPYVGDVVEVHLTSRYPKENGALFWRGLLKEVLSDAFVIAPVRIDENDAIEVEERDTVSLPWNLVKKAARRALFPKPAKPGKGRKSS
ncbi:MAG: ribosome maturation factor RimP [Desulfovibrio sp.]|nr:ribosome maturation factor RimP [Desulfovibrio sp.]